MLSGAIGCRNFGMPTAHTGRPYVCCAVIPHVASPRKHCKCGKAESDVLEALKYKENGP